MSSAIVLCMKQNTWTERQRDYLTRCAQGEAGRAIDSMVRLSNLETVYYFAREAATYAALLLDGPTAPNRYQGHEWVNA